MNKSVMIVGVGGQGTLLASRILGDAMMSQGFDVKVSEVHGMSQRGGSVVTYVRYGDKVYSPIIETGEADILLSFADGIVQHADSFPDFIQDVLQKFFLPCIPFSPHCG